MNCVDFPVGGGKCSYERVMNHLCNRFIQICRFIKERSTYTVAVQCYFFVWNYLELSLTEKNLINWQNGLM